MLISRIRNFIPGLQHGSSSGFEVRDAIELLEEKGYFVRRPAPGTAQHVARITPKREAP